MKAPINMWIDGVEYEEGVVIPKHLTRTAKVLLEIHERIVKPANPNYVWSKT